MSSKRIFVIDRSRTIQIILRTHFCNAGHQVIVCNTPQEALGILPGLPNAPDMIFLAIDDQREAYKVIDVAKRQRADTHIVAMVIKEEQEDIQRTVKTTDVSYLIKPFHIQDALALVSAPVPGCASSGTRTIVREGEA
ncbi:MAG TPA: response regulator [Ktedonobacteraceae bacterium]|nr:response regulator [Ktedonobacteraceae bacterium]